MLSKTLYIPLIMALLGLQAGLQTASGQNASAQASLATEFYTFNPTSTLRGIDIKGDVGTNSMTPQATPQACSVDAGYGATNYNGDAYIYCTNCWFSRPVCGTYQNDYPHRMTVDIESNARYLHIKSWAPWLMYPAGPIWYACHFVVCS